MNNNHELKLYRIALFFGAIIYPFFGYVYCDYYFQFDFDGFQERLSLGLLNAVCLIFSYMLKIPIRVMRLIVLVLTLLITSQYFYFASESNFHWMYITGLIQLPAICIVIFYRKIDAIIYFVFTVLLSILIFKNSPFVGVTYPLLISTYMLIYYIYLANRENLMADLKDKINEVEFQKSRIEEKNISLIKIGELATQVAHDIRSPVTALEAVSQMLGDEIDPKKKKLIENAAKRINDIANNLVSEYRVNLTQDLSSMKIDRSVTLNSLIEDIIEEKRLSLDSTNKIIFRAPASLAIPQNINSVEFQRIISNLINNSIEAFNKENGLIDISLFKRNSSVCIEIRDNGKGIPEEHIANVFNKGMSGKPKGAGLGLSHAKEYIESIGGSVAIESIPNRETKVIISLNVS